MEEMHKFIEEKSHGTILEEIILKNRVAHRHGNAVFSVFFEILKIFFEALDGTQFLLCVVEGRGGGADAGS